MGAPHLSGASRRTLVVSVATLALLAAGPAPNGAVAGPSTGSRSVRLADDSGSLVFIRGGDVWIARPDGSGARALTTNGTAGAPYRTPTQDDAGRIYALRGDGDHAMIVRLNQRGEVLQRFSPPITSFGTGFASVSPNGAALAYGAMYAAKDCSYTPCHTFFQHYVEYADARSGTGLGGSHHVSDGEFASWAGSSRTIVQPTRLNRVLLHRPSEPSATEWFASCLSYLEGCQDTDTLNYFPAANRQGDRFATSRVEDGPQGRLAYLLVLSTTGATTATKPPLPGAGCAYPAATQPPFDPTAAQMTLSAPSFSPDGHSIVFAERSGWAWITKVVRPVVGDCDATDPMTVLSDASQPHWSRARLSAVLMRLRWTRAKSPRLKGTAKVGRRLRPAMTKRKLRRGFKPPATRVRYQWLRNGHPIKHAIKASYRVKKADRHRRLRVRITGIRAGSTRTTVASRAVRVK